MLSTTDLILNNTNEFVHVGVDLAKNVIQVAYSDPLKKRFINRQFKRSEFIKFLQDTSFRKHIYVESCGACQFWCRFAKEHGHEGSIIPAAATKK
jgi:transposase